MRLPVLLRWHGGSESRAWLCTLVHPETTNKSIFTAGMSVPMDLVVDSIVGVLTLVFKVLNGLWILFLFWILLSLMQIHLGSFSLVTSLLSIVPVKVSIFHCRPRTSHSFGYPHRSQMQGTVIHPLVCHWNVSVRSSGEENERIGVHQLMHPPGENRQLVPASCLCLCFTRKPHSLVPFPVLLKQALCSSSVQCSWKDMYFVKIAL